MIKAIIIDDEPSSRTTLNNLVKKYCSNVEIVGMEESVTAGLEIIARLSPDLVFLDIQMPQLDGFDLLDLSDDRKFEVIFTTAYQDYTLQAIRNSALDYLLKPINIKELMAATKRAEEVINNKAAKTRSKTTIALPTMDSLEIVEMDDVIYCESDGNYTIFYLLDGEKKITSKPLSHSEEMLSEEFYRIHKSYIINTRHVKKYIKGRTGQVEMKNGAILDVAARRKEEFLKKLL